MPCDSNLRVKVPATGLVTYPAASVFCKKHIEIHESHRDGFWFLTEAKGLDQELAVKSLGIQLPLAGVYDCLKFVKPKLWILPASHFLLRQSSRCNRAGILSLGAIPSKKEVTFPDRILLVHH